MSDVLNRDYTFADYCTEAQLGFIPGWANQIKMASPPFAHQIGDLNHLALNVRAGLLNDPGVGKTRSIQAYGLWLASQGNKVIYIMPPILLPQFAKSLAATYQGYEQFVSSSLLMGSVPQRDKLIKVWEKKGWPDLLILSYRIFVQYWSDLLDRGYTCLIVDEATAVKNPSSQLHRSVKGFVGDIANSNGLVLLTGTAIETSPIDAYGLIALLNPTRYGSQKSFERMHVDYVQIRQMKIPTGFKHLDYLRDGLFANSRRVTKAECLDLPPRLISEIPVYLNKSHMALYRQLINERLAEVNGEMLDMTTASAIYQAMQRTLLCPEKFTDYPPKNELIAAMDDLLDTLKGHKVVVYVWYQQSVEKLKEVYKDWNPAVLYGKTTGANREKEKQRFIEDPTCTMLIANVRSGGVGVDKLQTVCSHAIFAEVCTLPGVFQQAIDRLHRSGQQAESVTAYVLVPMNTIAVKLRNDLVRKDLQQEAVMQDKRKVLMDLLGEEGLTGQL